MDINDAIRHRLIDRAAELGAEYNEDGVFSTLGYIQALRDEFGTFGSDEESRTLGGILDSVDHYNVHLEAMDDLERVRTNFWRRKSPDNAPIGDIVGVPFRAH